MAKRAHAMRLDALPGGVERPAESRQVFAGGKPPIGFSQEVYCDPGDEVLAERVARLALDAFVWTGAGSPTLEQRRKKLPGTLPTPEQQREAQRLKDVAIRAWAADRKVGTQPPTFPERR
mgnify:CR=1 FL=1